MFKQGNSHAALRDWGRHHKNIAVSIAVGFFVAVAKGRCAEYVAFPGRTKLVINFGKLRADGFWLECKGLKLREQFEVYKLYCKVAFYERAANHFLNDFWDSPDGLPANRPSILISSSISSQ